MAFPFGLEHCGSTPITNVYLDYPSLAEFPCLLHCASKYSPHTQLAPSLEYPLTPFSARVDSADMFPSHTTSPTQTLRIDLPALEILTSSSLFLNQHIPHSSLKENWLLQVLAIYTVRASFDKNLYSFEISITLLDLIFLVWPNCLAPNSNRYILWFQNILLRS
jgi:hypothetical protein